MANTKRLKIITGIICITIAIISMMLSIVIKEEKQTFMNLHFMFIILALILLKKDI